MDASIWVSRLVPQDVHHDASRRWLDEYTALGKAMISPMLLLPELAGAVSRRVGDPRVAHEALRRLRQLPLLRLVPLDRPLVETATDLAADFGVRGADAVYVAVAQRLQLPLLTWDADQRTRGGRAVVAHTPETIDPGSV
jgi:predicted nucleic acid-binding protein